MENMFRFSVKKHLESKVENKIIRLKGSLIAKGFTEIIHIDDLDEETHLNYCTIAPQKNASVRDYMAAYIAEHKLEDIISIL